VQLSLADIKLANFIDHLAMQPGGPMLVRTFQMYPTVWKVRETVCMDRKIATWRSTGRHRALSVVTSDYYHNLVHANPNHNIV
jgi:hypothetical protein